MVRVQYLFDVDLLDLQLLVKKFKDILQFLCYIFVYDINVVIALVLEHIGLFNSVHVEVAHKRILERLYINFLLCSFSHCK